MIREARSTTTSEKGVGMTRPWNRTLGWIVVVVVAADWCSKFLILNAVALHERVAIWGDWVSIVRLQNRGIAFGVLNNGVAQWQTPLLIVVAAVAVLVLTRLAREVTDTRSRLGLALVLGGALGNLGDRIANGGVTDFVLVRFFPFIFNVADVAVTMGGILLVLGLARSQESVPGRRR